MNNKTKITLSIIMVVLSLALLIGSSIFIETRMITSGGEAIIIIPTILVIAAVLYAAKIEYETHYYQCRKCGHTFKPTFKEYIMGSHTMTTRRLKCPRCEEKSWCKVLREE